VAEYRNIGWIEGPWVFQRKVTYHLEYSASGPSPVSGSAAFHKMIEGSKDGRTYQTILDKTNNNVTR